MEEKQVLSQVASTITAKPKTEITIEVKHRSFWDRLLRRPKERLFIIRPTIVSSIYMLSGKTVLWQEELFKIIKEDQQNIPAIIALIQANLKDVIYCTAVIIQNNAKQPNGALVKWLEDNTDAIDLSNIIIPVLGSTYMQAFLNSIVLVKGTSDVLKPKTSLKEAGEMIAPGA